MTYYREDSLIGAFIGLAVGIGLLVLSWHLIRVNPILGPLLIDVQPGRWLSEHLPA